MSKHLEREFELLRRELVAQFGLVEQMIQLSVRSLVERRSELASRVILQDKNVDAEDIRIEEECLKLLALHQPVASDMRWLVSVVKVNADLERMADLACNISERSISIDRYPLFVAPNEIDEMAPAVTIMVKDALDAFVDWDAAKALKVIQADDHIDSLNQTVIDQLHRIMKADSELIEPAIHCFSASRHLERIADLAENIAEEVIYLVQGDIVRHQHEQLMDSVESKDAT
ncbi:MAG: phosphate signaling complex protein PhoU [Rubripirellula sp.]